MAYNERLAERVRAVLARRRGVTERRMFGGIAFLVRGNMACGIVGDDLVVRVGPEKYKTALARPHVREMDFTGRPMTGYVYVATPGLRRIETLRSWINLGVTFARTFSPK